MINTLAKIHWIAKTQLGIDLRVMFGSLAGLPRYLRDLLRFHSMQTGRLELMPCLHDWNEEGGLVRDEYFWQDLLVARRIFDQKPQRHIDIGSRVDGFVAHVASFREIEIFDVRPITLQIPGVVFRQADLMRPVEQMAGLCDSLSCLHALEHFGLGRYGDPIDPIGFEHGFRNMAALLKAGGTFYLSVPVGVARVEFNAHRVFDPRTILDLASKNQLQVKGLSVIRGDQCTDLVTPNHANLSDLAKERYALGLFTFARIAEPLESCDAANVPIGNAG